MEQKDCITNPYIMIAHCLDKAFSNTTDKKVKNDITSHAIEYINLIKDKDLKLDLKNVDLISAIVSRDCDYITSIDTKQMQESQDYSSLLQIEKAYHSSVIQKIGNLSSTLADITDSSRIFGDYNDYTACKIFSSLEYYQGLEEASAENIANLENLVDVNEA